VLLGQRRGAGKVRSLVMGSWGAMKSSGFNVGEMEAMEGVSKRKWQHWWF
jgi:hypothetical protein